MKHSSHTELPPVLAQHLPIIQALCRKHQVKQLWAFGSVLRGDLGEHSDIDLLYVMDRESIPAETFLANFYAFYDGLKATFQREVDLINYQALNNPYFLEELDQDKVLLYDYTGEKISI
ncbi:MAG: nucleotidyltransferase domain-containing protein [Bacteroidota bacterium]